MFIETHHKERKTGKMVSISYLTAHRMKGFLAVRMMHVIAQAVVVTSGTIFECFGKFALKMKIFSTPHCHLQRNVYIHTHTPAPEALSPLTKLYPFHDYLHIVHGGTMRSSCKPWPRGVHMSCRECISTGSYDILC